IATMLKGNVIFRRMTPPPREVTQLRLQFSVRVLGADLGKGLASFGLTGMSSELVSYSSEALGRVCSRRLQESSLFSNHKERCGQSQRWGSLKTLPTVFRCWANRERTKPSANTN